MDRTADALRDRVEAFTRAHFRLPGTFHLHRAALGRDILRAPVNVALAPVFLLVMLSALICRLTGLRRAGAWLAARRILLPTAVARAIEDRIAADLLEGAPLSPRGRRLIADYTGVRSAVAEITTSLLVLSAGLLLFGTPTPGIASLLPWVTDTIAHGTAVARFPLGDTLGQVWYGVFPPALPVWAVIATGIALAMAASVVTVFAGLLADPVQAHLGLHQRRLLRLLHRIAQAEGEASGIAPEHVLARLADLTDAGLSLVRHFRP